MPLGNMGGWTFVIILIIVLLLFGAPRLPKLAKSLGESMRIFKGEMKTMKTDSAKNSSSGTAREDQASNSNELSGSEGTRSTASSAQRPATDDLSDGNDAQPR